MLMAPWLLMAPPRRLRGRAFTLIELIAVMTLIAILAAAAIPSLASVGTTKAGLGARVVQSDTAYARQRAIATGVRTWVTFEPDQDRWHLAADIAGTPGHEHATALARPETGRPWSVSLSELGLEDARIESVDFDGDLSVGFDWRGRPLNADGAPLAADGVVRFADGREVVIDAASGRVTAP